MIIPNGIVETLSCIFIERIVLELLSANGKLNLFKNDIEYL